MQSFNCRPYNGKRISKTKYERPKETYQDSLQNKQSIEEKLQGYDEVEMVEHIPIGTHTRYIVDTVGGSKFRTGGLLTMIQPEYVVMSNGDISWSVQRHNIDKKTGKKLKDTRFFRRRSKQENTNMIATVQEKIIEQLKAENEALKKKQKSGGGSSKTELF